MQISRRKGEYFLFYFFIVSILSILFILLGKSNLWGPDTTVQIRLKDLFSLVFFILLKKIIIIILILTEKS